MGNAYATPTVQQAPSTPQVAPAGQDENQALLGNAETQARMTGAPMELEVNPNEIGQARAATKAARSEVGAIDPDAELGDFFPIIRVFERASSDAREALATHLQIPTREDWLAAAQSDFEAQMNNFDTFGFKARAHESRVQRALRLVAAADEASAVALSAHDKQGRVRGALKEGIEIDPEASQDDLELMQDAMETTRLDSTGMAQREEALAGLVLSIDAVATSQLNLGGELSARRATLLKRKASAPAEELKQIDEAIKAIDVLGGLVESAVATFMTGAATLPKGAFAEDAPSSEWTPGAPRATAKPAASGSASALGKLASLAWDSKRGALSAQIGAVDSASRAALQAGDATKLEAAWGAFDSACAGFDKSLTSAQTSGRTQTVALRNTGVFADKGTGGSEHEDAAERLGLILDASQLQGTAEQVLVSAGAGLKSFAAEIMGKQETQGYASSLSQIVRRTGGSVTMLFDKAGHLEVIARRLRSQRLSLQDIADGTRALEET